jgi:tyrosine-protein phosphatase SIW14
MTWRLLHFFLVLACLAALSAPALPAQTDSRVSAASVASPAFGQKLRIPGIHNSGRINDQLYRGAQPKKQGLIELQQLGITTIVDLRSEDPEKSAWEGKQAESVGMRFVHIPVSGWSPPKDEQVAQFLALFRSDLSQKIFVHCRFGDDRTGVFIATYRMAIEKWSPSQALREMNYFGFNGFWHPSMKSFIRQFPEALQSSPALAAFRHPHPSATQLNSN